MYCNDCGQLVEEDLYGRLVHAYQTSDGHAPYLEEINGYR